MEKMIKPFNAKYCGGGAAEEGLEFGALSDHPQYRRRGNGGRSQNQRREQVSAELGRAQCVRDRGVGLRPQCRHEPDRHGGRRWPTGRRKRSPANTSRAPARWCRHDFFNFSLVRRWRCEPRLRSLIAFAFVFAVLSTSAYRGGCGKYQAVLGDCAGCHGKDLSGGITLMTPFGKLVTPNITPDKDTGIGNYSADDFRAAMKTGVAPGGKLLYPAMPYPVLCPDERWRHRGAVVVSEDRQAGEETASTSTSCISPSTCAS